MFVLLCFDEKNWAGARMQEKARACFENNHNKDFFVKWSGFYVLKNLLELRIVLICNQNRIIE